MSDIIAIILDKITAEAKDPRYSLSEKAGMFIANTIICNVVNQRAIEAVPDFGAALRRARELRRA